MEREEDVLAVANPQQGDEVEKKDFEGEGVAAGDVAEHSTCSTVTSAAQTESTSPLGASGIAALADVALTVDDNAVDACCALGFSSGSVANGAEDAVMPPPTASVPATVTPFVSTIPSLALTPTEETAEGQQAGSAGASTSRGPSPSWRWVRTHIVQEPASLLCGAGGSGPSDSLAEVGGPSPAPLISTANSGTKAVVHGCRLDQTSLEEALEVAMRSTNAEEAGFGEGVNNPWKRSIKLWPFVSLAAQSQLTPPPRFQQAMDTCLVCVLNAPQGHLLYAGRMLDLLESPDAGAVLGYLEWLTQSLRNVSGANPASSSGASSGTVLVTQRIRSALCSWASERAQLQQNATALVEAILTHGPEHHRSYIEWCKAQEARLSIQEQQEEECHRIAREIESEAAYFSGQLQQYSGAEWPHLARTSHASLRSIQQIITDILENQQVCWSYALEEYETLGARSTAWHAAACDARRKVRQHEQTFNQTTKHFIETAQQLVTLANVLLPKLQLLSEHCKELREGVEIRRRFPLIERELIAAEDDLDLAQSELRKHRRHARASRSYRSPQRVDTTASAVLEWQYELRVTHMEERVQALTEQLQDIERKLHVAEAAVPVVFELDDDENSGITGAPHSQHHGELLSPEEKLALKLANLQQFHEDVAVQVSELHAERDQVLRQVEERKADEALRQQVEPDFMCPITHERMNEPVLAADGHTYERQAIEKWLQMHNTSPMTGAPLAHRYLTENFALRHLINAYNADQSTALDYSSPRGSRSSRDSGGGASASNGQGREVGDGEELCDEEEGDDYESDS